MTPILMHAWMIADRHEHPANLLNGTLRGRGRVILERVFDALAPEDDTWFVRQLLAEVMAKFSSRHPDVVVAEDEPEYENEEEDRNEPKSTSILAD